MKVAVVHDYFTQAGGAEKVVEELYRLFPDPSLFATVAFRHCLPEALKDVRVRTSWMQNLPGIDRYYRLYFLLYPFAVGDLDLSGYDVVISNTSGYAKGVKTSREAVHVCYCHAPMRWVWNFDSYSQRESFGFGPRAVLPILIRGLKMWDEEASRQPDHFVANSRSGAERIRRAYGRTAEVIHPPIDTNRFHLSGYDPEDYYLVLSRLVSYKRVDLAVRACTERGKKLMVIGDGPDRKSLEAMAGPTVRFLGRASDEDVEYLAARCRALLFPGEEDFGMAPLEVASAGRPTIAYRAGGALDTVIDNVTGVFFDEQTADDLGDAIERFERQTWNARLLRTHAEDFNLQVFNDRFRSFLQRVGVPVTSLAPKPGGHSDVAEGVFAAHA
jgi:glycosyltransferase involved in cell wall biosynthesis